MYRDGLLGKALASIKGRLNGSWPKLPCEGSIPQIIRKYVIIVYAMLMKACKAEAYAGLLPKVDIIFGLQT